MFAFASGGLTFSSVVRLDLAADWGAILANGIPDLSKTEVYGQAPLDSDTIIKCVVFHSYLQFRQDTQVIVAEKEQRKNAK